MRIRFIRDNKSNKKKKMKEYLYIKNMILEYEEMILLFTKITKKKSMEEIFIKTFQMIKNNWLKEYNRNCYY